MGFHYCATGMRENEVTAGRLLFGEEKQQGKEEKRREMK